MKRHVTIFLFAFFSLNVFAEMDIQEANRIRIDGKLNDWRDIKWTEISSTISGYPKSISNAQWTAMWDDDTIYIAVKYDDSEIVLGKSSDSADHIQIYVRGDNGSSPATYKDDQNSAQSYSFGLSNDKINCWKKMGNFEKFPRHVRVKKSATLKGNTFIFELAIPVYDWFEQSRHRCSETEMYSGLEIGLDIAIIDAGKSGLLGTLGANKRDKYNNANAIAEQMLDD